VNSQRPLAARHGLSRKALELLLDSHPAIFGRAGAVMQLDLMLGAGRAFEVRAWLEPEHEAVLGFTPYHALQAWAAAGSLCSLTSRSRSVAADRADRARKCGGRWKAEGPQPG
jgi:hypothetical protein